MEEENIELGTPKRFRNSKGQFISTSDVENIRRFYAKSFDEEQRSRMPNLKEMIRKMDLETYKNTVNAGAGVSMNAPVMYVGESLVPTEMLNYKQKLSAAKKMNTKFFYKNKEVTKGELIDIIEKNIKKTRTAFIKENGFYYKTYIFLRDDRANNHLIFDPRKTKSPSQSY
jgi:hypothetical protein